MNWVFWIMMGIIGGFLFWVWRYAESLKGE